ncbi:transcriptional regulator XRE family [Candidatus Termititenax aidoneus]|uniref:Transcriptional regulator XRE family n=1 Tax=Termititenax aidoneus TaxID=2218524 RepID=A0A388TED8_TERA1|nr:transcriptional regulator XRE family [Candidatus Termititenax aidoneus]
MAKANVRYKPNMAFLRKIGTKLRQLREQKNLTLEELADLAGISYKYLQEVETAKYSFTVSVLHSITRALGISLAEFFKK